MCGIAGIHRRGDAPVERLGRLADTLLLGIENRGRDATGLLAMLPDGKVHYHREIKPASKFIDSRKLIRGDVRTVLLHTRFSTVGSRYDVRNAHPVINGGLAAIHNGTIYNHAEIFEAFNLKRHAEVDSEVIPALFSFAGWDHAAEAMDLFEGGAAFAVVNHERPDEVLLGRTESYPLVYFVNDEMVVWASTRYAIEGAFAMTYGGRPEGEFVEMDEWQLIRVNGALDLTQVRAPRPKPK
jgi:glucosamine 6-phosphate synthetase-like amidotransferase/phosphosugar isomerase protein